MSWVFVNILSKRGHRIAKLIAEYRAEEFSSAAVSYVALKQVAHGMVCLSSHTGGYIFFVLGIR